MTLDKLREALKDNKISYSSVETKELYNLFMFTTVNLQMDMKSLDYYYIMDVEELVNSDMPEDELETLKNQGWAFTEDGKNLVGNNMFP